MLICYWRQFIIGGTRVLISLCRSKILGARVTEIRHRYWSSLEIDEVILKAAGMHSFERVLVVNLSNGQRFETYLVAAPSGSKQVVLAGGGAFLGKVDDEIGCAVFSIVDESLAALWQLKVVILGAENTIQNTYNETMGLRLPDQRD